MVLYTLHLFAGGGGGILADLLLGHTPVGAVEIEEYQRRVLLSRQLDGSLPKFPIWDDVQTFRIDNPNTAGYIQNLKKIRSRLCICGGFPCQDISVAGKGAGIAGTRSGLWKDFARIIGEIRPRYAFLENSAAILVRGVDTVLGDLACMGYDAQWGVVSAADSGAPHQRRRWWCIASDTDGLRELQPQGSLPEFWGWPRDGCNTHSDTYRESIQKQPDTGSNAPKLAESGMGGMAHGLAAWLDETEAGIWFDAEEHGLKRTCSKIQDRVKRLKTLGNGQVPQTAALAWNLLMDHVK